MRIRIFSMSLRIAAAALLAGCATGYAPPPERPVADRCPANEVWVCEDRYPTRIESENRPEPFCRCDDPTRLY